MKISFEYDTEKDAAEIGKLQALVNALNPAQIQQKKNELESLLTPSTPLQTQKVTPIKNPPKTEYTCGETHWIEGAQVVIHAPVFTDKGTIGRNPNGYRLKDYKGVVHIIPNLQRFQKQFRDKLPCYQTLNNLAAGRRKLPYNGWTNVQDQYWHIQPYLNIDFELLAA